MDAHDLIGKTVTITAVDLEAPGSFDVAHVTFQLEGGPAIVLEAHLHQARAKAVLTMCDEAGRWLGGTR